MHGAASGIVGIKTLPEIPSWLPEHVIVGCQEGSVDDIKIKKHEGGRGGGDPPDAVGLDVSPQLPGTNYRESDNLENNIYIIYRL